MSDEPQNLPVRMMTDGATAQLRVVTNVLVAITDDGLRIEARRLHAELIRQAAQLARRYDFELNTRSSRER